jgi:hypothetical protein
MKMKHKQNSLDHMYKRTLKKTLLVQALAAALGTTVLMTGISTTAWAQSNVTGSINGQAAAGGVVIAENINTGAKRQATVDAGGRYQILALPTGSYRVQLLRNNAVVNTRTTEVLIGQGSEVDFVAGGAQSVDQIQVTARRQTIDVSSSNSGATFTAKELEKLPVAANVGAVIQLAPNTTRGDTRYGGANAPSFGGSSASENAYYINGFPVTNVLYQVGFSQLPFGAIGQAQILTGGYGAEFGRSTGGVVNITTKSGTNEWEFGLSTQFTPNGLRSKAKNIYYPTTGTANNAATDGTIRLYNEGSKNENFTYGGTLSGPIIKDRLFVFVAAEGNRTTADFARLTSASANATTGNAVGGWQSQVTDIPRYIAKLDWNITDNHHLEYTRIHDQSTIQAKFYGLNYKTLSYDTVQSGGSTAVNSSIGGTTATNLAAGSGADLDIVKYSGYLTEDLTLTALAGKSKSEHSLRPFGFQPGVFQTTAPVAVRAPGLTYLGSSPQTATGNLLVPGAKDEQKAYRIDLEWKLGQHTVRAGLDNNTQKSVAGSATAGGGIWAFGRTALPTDKPDPNSNSPASGGGLGAQGYFVNEIHSATSTTPKVKQSAQYIEDRFQITKNVLLSLGLRNEQFSNYNGDGIVYVEQKTQIAPRLGASWDFHGDSSLKLFGALGRYHLQLPTNVAVRGAGSSLNTQHFFTYTGVDAITGAPTGLVAISPLFSANNELGGSEGHEGSLSG